MSTPDKFYPSLSQYLGSRYIETGSINLAEVEVSVPGINAVTEGNELNYSDVGIEGVEVYFDYRRIPKVTSDFRTQHLIAPPTPITDPTISIPESVLVKEHAPLVGQTPVRRVLRTIVNNFIIPAVTLKK